MSADLKQLYNEVIRHHNEQPFHFSRRDNIEPIRAYNPVCGDRFDLFIEMKNETIGEVYFHGFGCAISKASASNLAKMLTGMKQSDALSLCNRFIEFLDGKSRGKAIPLPAELTAFAGVHDFPERYDCACLPWKEVGAYLKGGHSK